MLCVQPLRAYHGAVTADKTGKKKKKNGSWLRTRPLTLAQLRLNSEPETYPPPIYMNPERLVTITTPLKMRNRHEQMASRINFKLGYTSGKKFPSQFQSS
jgi:hypothetical protein